MLRYLVAAVVAFGLAAGAAEARPFTARDLAMLDRVSAPRLSPDGRYLIHSLRKTDWDSNGALHALHLIDLRAPGAPLVITSGEKAAPSARWSADGSAIYFLSSKSGSSQVWRAGPDGKGRRQMSALPVDVTSFRLIRGGDGMLVSADVHPDCATLACTRTRIDDKAKVKPTGVRIRKGANRFWDSYEDDRRVGLFHIAFDQHGAPAEAPSLLGQFDVDVAADDANVVVSNDGRTVYFVSRDPAVEQGGMAYSALYSVPVDGSRAPRLVEGGPRRFLVSPVLSPDGSRLAFVDVRGAANVYGWGRPMVIDLKSGRVREVGRGLDVTVSRVGWSPDGKRLLAIGDVRGQSPLLAIDVASGAVSRLSSEGVVSDFDQGGGTIAFVRETLTSPQQIFVAVGSGPAQQVTRVGAEVLAQTPLGEPEQFRFAGWNGESVHGYVVKPHGYVEGRKYPVAFLIHGGPHGSFNNGWSYRWNPQVWAGMGYAVVMVDFHGSSGYGEAFGQSIINHWGDRPLEDLQKGWSHALSRYSFLDSNRACALGGSYGGYMVAWIASQWQQPWKCLVNHAGVFDVRSMGWSMDSINFIEAQTGGGRMEDMERFNPALHTASWKVPMLIVHGSRDYRVPLDQGIAAHNAARRSGIATEFLLFPDENHWILKPQNSVQWYQVVEEWLDRWTDPAKTAQAR